MSSQSRSPVCLSRLNLCHQILHGECLVLRTENLNHFLKLFQKNWVRVCDCTCVSVGVHEFVLDV